MIECRNLTPAIRDANVKYSNYVTLRVQGGMLQLSRGGTPGHPLEPPVIDGRCQQGGFITDWLHPSRCLSICPVRRTVYIGCVNFKYHKNGAFLLVKGIRRYV